MTRLKRDGWPYSHPPNVPFKINRASPQAKGIVAWWPTLGSAGADVLRDLSGRDSNGELPGGAAKPAWMTDRDYGFGLSLDGGDYINIPDSDHIDLGNTGSICLVLRGDDWSNNPILIGKMPDGTDNNTNYRMEFYNNKLYITLGSGAAFDQVSKAWIPVAGTLYQIWATWDGTNIRLYVNGVQLGASGAQTITPAANAADAQLGTALNKAGEGTRRFKGTMLAARLMDIAIHPSIIGATYNPYTRWELYRPLVRWWAVKGSIAAGVPGRLMRLGVG